MRIVHYTISKMMKENSFTKNEKKFEQWLLQQYGITKKEEREYTVKGNLLSLGEIGLSAWGIASAGATKLVVPGKFLASNADDTAKKALQQDTIEDAVEGTLKKEVAEEVAENTAKKEIADTAEDLSQKVASTKNILRELDSNNPFYKPSGGSNLDDFMTIHAEKHAYNPNIKSTKNRTQFGENVNVAKLREDTMLYPDKVIYDSEHKMIKYIKEYNFNISTADTPTGSHRVFINLETKAGKTNRNSQFPYYRGDK